MEHRANINRYVFHVTDKFNRKSILEHGLRQSKKNYFNIPNAVYAHNGSVPDNYWYPMNMDYIDCKEYDFWRIDTHLLGAEWFLDLVMSRDANSDCIKGLFCYTKNHIPVACLTLFTFQGSREYSYQRDGVAHVRRLEDFRKHEWSYNANMNYLLAAIKVQQEQLFLWDI